MASAFVVDDFFREIYIGLFANNAVALHEVFVEETVIDDREIHSVVTEAFDRINEVVFQIDFCAPGLVFQ